jgi:hypothetical protein
MKPGRLYSVKPFIKRWKNNGYWWSQKSGRPAPCPSFERLFRTERKDSTGVQRTACNAVWGKGSSDCDETTRLPGSFVTTALMHALLLVEVLLFVLPLLCSQVIASVKSIIW